ncbi:MAG: S8 family serine peptidase, partial [Vicinamibacterales bacterium]
VGARVARVRLDAPRARLVGARAQPVPLVERAVDAMLESPGIVLVQSVGNYADAAMHTHARIGPAQRQVLQWMSPERDRTPNELEIWYSGRDVFEVMLAAPDGQTFSAALGERVPLYDGPIHWGNLYHRRHEPNSGLNHIVVYLYTAAPRGTWRVTVRGVDVVDGRLHAWIERDAGNRHQSRFAPTQATSNYTTNTICNCYTAIAVGAYDSAQPTRPPTRFSSRGPTADGRQKPEVSAPGQRIRAARSLPRSGWQGEPRLTVKSGTSMAAPWVSGTVAVMLAVAGRPLSIHDVRRALIGATDPLSGQARQFGAQLGYGYLNTARAVASARRLGRLPDAPVATASADTDTALPFETAETSPDERHADDTSGLAALEHQEREALGHREAVARESERVAIAVDVAEALRSHATATATAPAPCGCGGATAKSTTAPTAEWGLSSPADRAPAAEDAEHSPFATW